MALLTAEEIIRQYPILFQERVRSQWPRTWSGFEHGPGWNSLIEALCYSLYTPYRMARNEYIRMRKVEGKTPLRAGVAPITAVDVERARLAMSEAELELPRFLQIKEKFGTLRVYLDHADDRIMALMDMAERLSEVTCEQCGEPGELRTGGWLKTLCDEHAAQRSAR